MLTRFWDMVQDFQEPAFQTDVYETLYQDDLGDAVLHSKRTHQLVAYPLRRWEYPKGHDRTEKLYKIKSRYGGDMDVVDIGDDRAPRLELNPPSSDQVFQMDARTAFTAAEVEAIFKDWNVIVTDPVLKMDMPRPLFKRYEFENPNRAEEQKKLDSVFRNRGVTKGTSNSKFRPLR